MVGRRDRPNKHLVVVKKGNPDVISLAMFPIPDLLNHHVGQEVTYRYVLLVLYGVLRTE